MVKTLLVKWLSGKPNTVKKLLRVLGVKRLAFDTKYGEISVPIESKSIIRDFLKGNYFGESEIISFLKQETNSKIVLNVGANVGTTARIISQAEKYKKILCFEPHPENFYGLKLNCAHDDALLSYNEALGARKGILSLNVKPDSVGRHSFKQNFGKGSIDVTVRTVEDYVAAGEQFDIYMDVEGWEVEVLKGANSVLKNCGICAMEWNGQLYSDADKQDAIEMLSRAGFKTYINLANDIHSEDFTRLGDINYQCDLAFVRRSTGGNYLD